MDTDAKKPAVSVVNARTLREAQAILERYKYSFLAKKIGKMAAALEMSEPDDDA